MKSELIITTAYRHSVDVLSEPLTPEEIAASLTMQCRFNGHCFPQHYSVAAHSLICEWIAERLILLCDRDKSDGTRGPKGSVKWPAWLKGPCPEKLPLWALTHDCAEAIIGDRVAPVKWYLSQTGKSDGLDDLENAVDAEIHYALGLQQPDSKAKTWVKLVDLLALQFEKSVLWQDHPGLWPDPKTYGEVAEVMWHLDGAVVRDQITQLMIGGVKDTAFRMAGSLASVDARRICIEERANG